MPTDIHLVQTSADIEIVSTLAREIWTDHFTPIIGKPQVEYMLEKFQSSEPIKHQISEGCEYYLASIDNESVGYTALITNLTDRKMMISKLYILSEVRGTGVGTALLSHIESICSSRNISRLWLTVNKYNDIAISWYKHRGFVVTDAIKTDIGSGFYMDDYLMEKALFFDK
jgi:ribosomal protein S18 acetylase RimI-like enzyme